jgi:hypothetical protein
LPAAPHVAGMKRVFHPVGNPEAVHQSGVARGGG